MHLYVSDVTQPAVSLYEAALAPDSMSNVTFLIVDLMLLISETSFIGSDELRKGICKQISSEITDI